jgi:hypothetical protein
LVIGFTEHLQIVTTPSNNAISNSQHALSLVGLLTLHSRLATVFDTVDPSTSVSWLHVFDGCRLFHYGSRAELTGFQMPNSQDDFHLTPFFYFSDYLKTPASPVIATVPRYVFLAQTAEKTPFCAAVPLLLRGLQRKHNFFQLIGCCLATAVV